jgi:hypothetical protein
VVRTPVAGAPVPAVRTICATLSVRRIDDRYRQPPSAIGQRQTFALQTKGNFLGWPSLSPLSVNPPAPGFNGFQDYLIGGTADVQSF